MLPNLFLVGAARAGTTSLWHYLSRCQGVFFPRRKEPKFFSAPENRFPHTGPGDQAVDATVVRDWAAYTRLFADSGRARIVGDASVDYLFFPGVAERIRRACPDAQVLIVLRDPAARAFSAYRYMVMSGRETLSFEDALDREDDRRNANYEFIWQYRRAGLYAGQIQRYLQVFGPDRVHVILFEELIRQPAAIVAPVLRVLGVDPPRHPDRLDQLEMSWVARHRIARAFAARRSWWLNRLHDGLPGTFGRLQLAAQQWAASEPVTLAPSTGRRLRAAYEADRQALETLLGQPTGWAAEDRCDAVG